MINYDRKKSTFELLDARKTMGLEERLEKRQARTELKVI